MLDESLNDLQDASEHLRNLINHAGAGHIDADTARRRFLEYLGDTSHEERARMHVEHFQLREAMSWTAYELSFLGQPGREWMAHENARQRLGVEEYEWLVPPGARLYAPR